MIGAIRGLGIDVVHVAPQPTTRLQQGWGLLKGWPHNRALYNTFDNRTRIAAAAIGCDAAIISWEPFDCFVPVLDLPLIAVLHNITSQSLASARPESMSAALFACMARSWEKKCYSRRGRLIAVAALSRADEKLVREVRNGPVLYTPPGMPPRMPLDMSAVFTAELTIEGTYDWWPKRRDLALFVREYTAAGRPFPVRADNLPSSAMQGLQPVPLDDASVAVRVGLITDRFKSGFKLKSTSYIAKNCIVLSYADIVEDFSSIADHELFVRRIRHAGEIQRHLDDIRRISSPDLVSRFEAFKMNCARLFSWRQSAERLVAPLNPTVHGAEGLSVRSADPSHT
jgi:hypothetical protein